MPNWCANVLKVSGSGDEVERFDNAFMGLPAPYPITDEVIAPTETRYCFNALHPMPKEVAQSEAWYNWSVNNWGTKWDIYYVGFDCVDKADDSYTYSFTTAWSPPERWLEHVVKQFPDLIFEISYYEPGMCFAGRVTYVRGKETCILYLDAFSDKIVDVVNLAIALGLEDSSAFED
jgi:hypothetical protein